MKFLKNLFKKDKVEEAVQPEVVEKPVIKDNFMSIVTIAMQHEATILAGNQNRINFIRDVAPEVEVLGFAKNFTKHVTDGEFPNGVVIDKSVSQEMVEYLKAELPHIKIIEV